MERVLLKQKKIGVGRNGLPPPYLGRGRPKGAVNKISRALKDAILLAAEEVGEDGEGKDGLVGFLRRLARREPKSFAGLLGRILPLQVAGKDDGPIQHEFTTKEEIRAELARRGLPTQIFH